MVIPDEDSWLPEYMTKYVKSQLGQGIILRWEPEEYYQRKGWNYLNFLKDGEEVTELARQNGYSLVITSAGQVGWVKSHLIIAK